MFEVFQVIFLSDIAKNIPGTVQRAYESVEQHIHKTISHSAYSHVDLARLFDGMITTRPGQTLWSVIFKLNQNLHLLDVTAAINRGNDGHNLLANSHYLILNSPVGIIKYSYLYIFKNVNNGHTSFSLNSIRIIYYFNTSKVFNV